MRGAGVSLTGLANCYADLGEVRQAIDFYEQALAIDRELGHRHDEAIDLDNLGNRYADLGEVRRAIDFHEQALAIDREIGYRGGEASNLGALGGCYADLGEVRRAIDFHEQALAINGEIGYRGGEASNLGGLGSCYANLGEVRRAIDFHEQALAIDREIGDRAGEAWVLTCLAEDNDDLGAWEPAVRFCEEAIAIADESDLTHWRGEGRLTLATVYLHAGDLGASRETAHSARMYDYGPRTAEAALVLGIVLSRQGEIDGAKRPFRDALESVDTLLELAADNYRALDTKALALSGLALVGDSSRVTEASTVFGAARAITRAPGIVRRVLRLFDALAACDEGDVLGPVRHSAGGDGV